MKKSERRPCQHIVYYLKRFINRSPLLSLLLATTVFASAERLELEFGREIIDRLLQHETRVDALREIVLAEDATRGKSDWEQRSLSTFMDYHQDIQVTLCPGSSQDEPLYLVSFRVNYDAIYRNKLERHSLLYPETARERAAITRLLGEPGVGKPAAPETLWEPPLEPLKDRVLIFLNTSGRKIWPFNGNNLIDGGILHDLNNDGILERLETTNMGVYDTRKGEPNIKVQVLEVYTVEFPSRPLLRVVLNWHSYAFDRNLSWDWTLKDIDADGFLEIIIGPPVENGVEPAAVFRWDASRKEYVGPSGGRDARFITLDPNQDRWEALRDIKQSGGMSYAPMPPASGKKVFFERSPYVHRSLAELKHSELFHFMWGGKEEHPRPPPAAGEFPRRGERPRREFKVPKDLFELEPPAAAQALAQANRTEQHLADFELFLLEGESPPGTEWILTTLENRLEIGAIQLGGTSAAWWRTVYSIPPIPRMYPYGRFSSVWRRGEISSERAQWLNETLWWLTRLRSAPKHLEALEFENELVRRDGFGTPPTEFGFHTLDPEGKAILDYPTDLPLRHCWQWVGPYDKQVCRTLAFTLWEHTMGEFKKSGREAEPLEALQFFDDSSKSSFPEDVPAIALAQAVTAVGDVGDVDALSLLQTIAQNMPEPSQLELDWREAKALWEELATMEGRPPLGTWKSRHDAYQSTTAQLRGHLAWHLRERLPKTIKQIQLVGKTDTITELASSPGEELAIWALRRLEEQDPEAALTVLESVFSRGPSEWRERILSYRANTDIEAAKTLYLALPKAERIPLMEGFLRKISGQTDGTEWIEPLLEVIEAQTVATETRAACVQLLVPRYKSLKFPDPMIAERLESVLQSELRRGSVENNERLLNELLRALVSRKQTEDVFDYAFRVWSNSDKDEFVSYPLLELLRIGFDGLTPEESKRLWQIFDPAENVIRSERANYVGYVYLADLRQAHDVISRMATRRTDEIEPADYGNSTDLLERGREHYARQLIAVWDEPDSLTRAKCLLIFGMQLGQIRFYTDKPKPDDVALDRIKEYLETASEDDRLAFKKFIAWLNESEIVQERFKRNHYSRHFLYRVRKMMEPKE